MSFVEDYRPEHEPKQPIPSYQEASQTIAKNLIESFQYARLSESDIHDSGVLEEGENFSRYVARILDFNQSIIPDAFRWMEERLPKTIESSVTHHLGVDHLFTPDEVRKIRMEALRQIPRSEEDHDRAIYDLTAKIISYASPVNFGQDVSADPDIFTNLSDMEILHRQLPQLVRRGAESLWAVRIPPILRESEDEYDFSDGPGSFLVVGDIDASEMLSSEVFSNDALLKFFLKQEIRNRQKALLDALRDRIAEISKQKIERIQTNVDKVNGLLRQTLVQHLLKDVQSSGPLQFVDLYRDHHDVSAIESGIPRASAVGRESNMTVFHIRQPSAENGRVPENSLEFTWKYPFPDPDGSITEGKAFIMLINGEIWYSNGDFGHWEKAPEWDSKERDMRRVFNLFEDIQLTTIEEWLNDKQTAYANALQRAALIRSSGSSADLLKLQQDYGFSGYPTHERFIVPENIRVEIVDEIPPVSMEGGFSTN